MWPLRGALRIFVVVVTALTMLTGAIAGDGAASATFVAPNFAAAEPESGQSDAAAAPQPGSSLEIALVTGDGQQGAPASTTLVCPASNAGCTP